MGCGATRAGPVCAQQRTEPQPAATTPSTTTVPTISAEGPPLPPDEQADDSFGMPRRRGSNRYSSEGSAFDEARKADIQYFSEAREEIARRMSAQTVSRNSSLDTQGDFAKSRSMNSLGSPRVPARRGSLGSASSLFDSQDSTGAPKRRQKRAATMPASANDRSAEAIERRLQERRLSVGETNKHELDWKLYIQERRARTEAAEKLAEAAHPEKEVAVPELGSNSLFAKRRNKNVGASWAQGDETSQPGVAIEAPQPLTLGI